MGARRRIPRPIRSYPLAAAVSLWLLASGGAPAHAAAADESDTPAARLTFDYDAASVSNLSGGIAQSSTYIGNLHLRGLFDLDRAWAWHDTRFFLDALWIHGGNPDAAPGDALGVDNLAAPHRAQIEEAWIERNFAGDRVSLLAGLYDINTEFYRSQSGGLFLNSGLGIGTELGASGVEGPSTFPRTSLGVRFAYKPSENTVLRAAVLDGVPVIRPDGRVRAFESGDGELYLMELASLDRPTQTQNKDQRWRIGRNAMLPAYQGKLAIGAWHYTTRFERLDPVDPRPPTTASGAYAIVDRVVAHLAGDDGRPVSLFAQVGVGDPTVERFGKSASFGVVSMGAFSSRPNDEIGLAFVTARNGSPYLRQQNDARLVRAESSVELTYLAQIGASFALQPDLQYVIHPNTDRSIPDAWVFSLRLEVTFGN
jgi:porin